MDAKLILALVIAACATVWFSALSFHKIIRIRRASHWSIANGRVLESLTFKDPKHDGKTHFLIRYEFEVRGHRIEGTSPRASGDWFWNNSKQQEFVDRFKKGAPVDVYYDSGDPRLNCIDRTDMSGIYAMLIVAGGAAALGAMLVWLELTELRKYFWA